MSLRNDLPPFRRSKPSLEHPGQDLCITCSSSVLNLPYARSSSAHQQTAATQHIGSSFASLYESCYAHGLGPIRMRPIPKSFRSHVYVRAHMRGINILVHNTSQ